MQHRSKQSSSWINGFCLKVLWNSDKVSLNVLIAAENVRAINLFSAKGLFYFALKSF